LFAKACAPLEKFVIPGPDDVNGLLLFIQAGAHVTLIARRADKLEQVKKEAEAANKEGKTGKGKRIL
jgi:hypothetical protein